MVQVQKRTILITGCSDSGAGHALALEFHRQGLRVFAPARSIKSPSTLEEKGIETLALDVTLEDGISSVKKEIASRTGGTLDMLFNNAGSMFEIPAIEADPQATKSMFEANVFGLFNMVTAFTPLLLASSSNPQLPPTIVNTSSIVSRVPFSHAAQYNASKAAVSSYSDTLRIELAPLGIKVVTLYMGVVATGITNPDRINFGSSSLYEEVEEGLRQRNEFARQVVKGVLDSPTIGKGEHLWKGASATAVWALNAFGWRKIFDGSIQQTVGLTSAVKRLIYERGQQSVSTSHKVD
ncbi:hypothetical protein BJ875DRAFT_503863 [Amylocarpus encephaloides]|uniref:NADPH-dependent 1-acyldihydroxyacetone phosphate reductase n=1 Tax=Amylocarpus encephaloides TaxID=45428 RepID=A0A9P7YKT7_9HELO|nr:hypothetical protein BJ875DRAFT_503863 [Amylocarpus encephaloides]